MSQENMGVVRRLSALASAGNWDAAMELLAPDVEWVLAKEHPEARTLVGREAVAAYRRERQETLPEEYLKQSEALKAVGLAE
jgi:ketosteroid isomerase-like protein